VNGSRFLSLRASLPQERLAAMASEIWIDRAPAGSDEFLRLSCVWSFNVLADGGGGFYVRASLDNGQDRIVAVSFASAAAARDWVADVLKSSNVK
jgi:hypothetical protein